MPVVAIMKKIHSQQVQYHRKMTDTIEIMEQRTCKERVTSAIMNKRLRNRLVQKYIAC